MANNMIEVLNLMRQNNLGHTGIRKGALSLVPKRPAEIKSPKLIKLIN